MDSQISAMFQTINYENLKNEIYRWDMQLRVYYMIVKRVSFCPSKLAV